MLSHRVIISRDGIDSYLESSSMNAGKMDHCAGDDRVLSVSDELKRDMKEVPRTSCEKQAARCKR